MASKIIKIKKIYSHLYRVSLPEWLIIVIAVSFIFRIPSFFEPFNYGDEMIYLTLGNGIRKGMVLYRDIHDNKPPLLYFLAAISGNVFWFRVILAVWMSGTIIVFWKLVSELFEKEVWITRASVFIFAVLTTIPTFEGQVSNSEIFMMGPTILAFYIALRKKATLKHVFVSGLLMSIATLFKMPAMFDVGALGFLWILSLKLTKKSFVEFGSKILFFGIGFLGTLVFTFVWYFLKGAFHDYLIAAFLQNVGYLSSFRPSDTNKPFIIKNAPLLIRSGIVFLSIVILFVLKKKLSKAFLFVVGWMLFSVFAMTLSERPYPHYILQVIPSFSILLAMFFFRKNIEQVLVIIPMTLFVVPIYFYHFWYYPSLPYYQRFFKYATRQISREEYLHEFEGNVNKNYKVAQAIDLMTNENEKVFVWGDNSSAVYALSNRFPPIKYVANYHIKDFSSIENINMSLTKSPPKLIVILGGGDDLKIDKLLLQKYNLALDIEGAKIWQENKL